MSAGRGRFGLCDGAGLGVEELALTGQAVGVAVERAVRAHDSVTRNHDRDGVGGAGCTDGPGCARCPHGRRDLAVRTRLAGGYAAESLPDLPSKGSGVNIEGQGIGFGAAATHRQIRH
jgi:hypothetical protein